MILTAVVLSVILVLHQAVLQNLLSSVYHSLHLRQELQVQNLIVQPQVLVATPGRLIDLINRGKVDLSEVRFLVLDEADEMLNMGFQEDIETILKDVPETRRTLLFSATMPNEIAKISRQYMHDAAEITAAIINITSIGGAVG